MVHPWAKYDEKSTKGFLRFRVNEILVRTDGPDRTDGQPENIMPPAPYGAEA